MSGKSGSIAATLLPKRKVQSRTEAGFICLTATFAPR
jgi:hypothetical protein